MVNSHLHWLEMQDDSRSAENQANGCQTAAPAFTHATICLCSNISNHGAPRCDWQWPTTAQSKCTLLDPLSYGYKTSVAFGNVIYYRMFVVVCRRQYSQLRAKHQLLAEELAITVCDLTEVGKVVHQSGDALYSRCICMHPYTHLPPCTWWRSERA